MAVKKTTDTFYSIPQNWKWTTLENVAEIIGGGTPSSKNDSYYEGGEISWITPADLSNYKNAYISRGAKNITELGLKKSSARLLPKDTVCLSTRAPIGYVAIAKNSLSTNQGFKNFLPSEKYLPKYLYWYLKGNTDTLKSFASGTTFLELSKSRLGKIPIPVPPLAEQKRIVERIDSLFEKLDAAKKILQDIVDGYELRRAAILHRAFTGELTEDFRKKNNLSLDDWQEKTFKENCTVVRGGSPRPAGSPKYYGGTIPFMKVADITNNHSPYIYSAKNTITEAGLTKTRMVKANTLLLTNSGATLGVPAICKIDTTLNDGIAAFLNLDSSSLLFYYFFWCSKTQELRAINKGAAQPNLNTNIIGDVKINLPPLEEQKEIARRLDSLLGKENQAKEIAENLLSEIETLKKTILARAFRGELGTNAPEDID